jgi:hypothetical protein
MVAVMLALPGATAVTNPDVDTVATAVAEVDQMTEVPATVFPDASRAVAWS